MQEKLTAGQPDCADSFTSPFLWHIKGSSCVQLPTCQPCVCRWTRVKTPPTHGPCGTDKPDVTHSSAKRLEATAGVAHNTHRHTHTKTHLSRVEDTAGCLSGLDWVVWVPVGEVDIVMVDPFEDSGAHTHTDQPDPHSQTLAIWRMKQKYFTRKLFHLDWVEENKEWESYPCESGYWSSLCCRWSGSWPENRPLRPCCCSAAGHLWSSEVYSSLTCNTSRSTAPIHLHTLFLCTQRALGRRAR